MHHTCFLYLCKIVRHFGTKGIHRRIKKQLLLANRITAIKTIKVSLKRDSCFTIGNKYTISPALFEQKYEDTPVRNEILFNTILRTGLYSGEYFLYSIQITCINSVLQHLLIVIIIIIREIFGDEASINKAIMNNLKENICRDLAIFSFLSKSYVRKLNFK